MSQSSIIFTVWLTASAIGCNKKINSIINAINFCNNLFLFFETIANRPLSCPFLIIDNPLIWLSRNLYRQIITVIWQIHNEITKLWQLYITSANICKYFIQYLLVVWILENFTYTPFLHSYIILRISLYVTYIDNPISSVNPVICIAASMFSFSGFLLIASINNITIFPPSRGGNGSRFVIPRDSDISPITYIYCCHPLVCVTKLDTPHWSH